MSLTSKKQKIKTMLEIEGLTVKHYWKRVTTFPYCIWQEDGESTSFHTDNHKAEQVIHGTIDYYTQTDMDTMADTIQDAMTAAAGVSWFLNSVQYEEETNVIHYEWEFEVV